MSTLFSRKCGVEDLLNHKDDGVGYIEGRVFMVWPPRQGVYRIQLEAFEQSAARRFQVEIPYQDGMVFRPHESVSLSLKGATILPYKASSAPHTLPIALRYPDGVALRYMSGKSKGKVVNTWQGSCMRLLVVNWLTPVQDTRTNGTILARFRQPLMLWPWMHPRPFSRPFLPLARGIPFKTPPYRCSFQPPTSFGRWHRPST